MCLEHICFLRYIYRILRIVGFRNGIGCFGGRCYAMGMKYVEQGMIR